MPKTDRQSVLAAANSHVSTVRAWQEIKQISGIYSQHPKVMNLPWIEKPSCRPVITRLTFTFRKIMTTYWQTVSGNSSSLKSLKY